MRIRGLGRLNRAARRVLGPYRRGALILAYHRVAEYDRDPFLLHVSPRTFARHLEIIRRAWRPVPLRDLAGRAVRRRSVVITLDDGYADNLREAKPLLARADCPATVFVVSGAVGRRRGFWWDTLEQCMLDPPDLPRRIELPFANGTAAWELPPHAFTPSAPAWRTWHVYRDDFPSPRHRVLKEIVALVRPLPNGEKERLLDLLARQTGVPTEIEQRRRAVDANGLRELAAGGLVDIGAHTVSHPVLSRLTDREQTEEIVRSRTDLEALLGTPVVSFAYPHGAKEDYTLHSVSAVRAAGFTVACSNFPGMASAGTSPFELPRHLVEEWDGPTFERRLEEWLRQ